MSGSSPADVPVVLVIPTCGLARATDLFLGRSVVQRFTDHDRFRRAVLDLSQRDRLARVVLVLTEHHAVQIAHPAGFVLINDDPRRTAKVRVPALAASRASCPTTRRTENPAAPPKDNDRWKSAFQRQ